MSAKKTIFTANLIITTLLAIAITSTLLFFTLSLIKSFLFSYLSDPQAIYEFRNSKIFSLTSALLLGVYLADRMTAKFYKKVYLKESQHYFNLRNTDILSRLFSNNKIVTSTYLFLILLFEMMAHNCFYIFTDKEIRFSPFLKFETITIPYSEISQLLYYKKIKSPDGRIRQKLVRIAKTNDGRIYNDYDSPIPHGKKEDIFLFIEKKANIQRVDGGVFIRRLTDIGN